MRTACASHGMKPVCDYPGYCKNDNAALYIGQSQHISYAPHRKTNSYFPSGWSSIRDKWSGLCVYVAKGHANSALCNQPTNSHSWQTAASQFKNFMCGKVDSASGRRMLFTKHTPWRVLSEPTHNRSEQAAEGPRCKRLVSKLGCSCTDWAFRTQRSHCDSESQATAPEH